MHAVRKSILEILKRRGQATIQTLADELDMAPVSVRHHLDLLIGDGLVTVVRSQRQNSVGRPQQVYALTDEANAYFPNRFRELADKTLDALKGVLSEEALLAVMADFAAQTAAPLRPQLSALPTEQRVEMAIRLLTELGYMAECERVNDDFVIHTCNCPYADLADDHRELCHMDLMLVSELTGLAPQRIKHIVAGDGRCSYRLVGSSVQVIPLLPDSVLMDVYHGQDSFG